MNLEGLTYRGYIYDLINQVNNGRKTKDFNLSEDQIGSWLIDKRYKYLSQDISKAKKIDSTFIQSLGCIELMSVDKSSCCSIDIGCNFLRSVLPIPALISIHRFGPIDITAKQWSIIEYLRVPLEKYSPSYSKKQPKGYFTDTDGYLYVYYDSEIAPEFKFLTTVNLMGVLVDPREARHFNDCNTGTACWSEDTLFPMTKKMWEIIKKDILQNELRIAEITTEDESNNSKADSNVNDLRKMK